MKQEDKDLLLKDLCARLPYYLKVNINEKIETLNVIGDDCGYYFNFLNDNEEGVTIENIKPYLFPISSMTEEQKKEYYSLADDVTIKPGQGCYLGIKIHCIKLGISDNPHEEVWDYINLDALDWLNKNHFDYRGLIEKGLAIDATGLNIYTSISLH